MYNNIPKGCDTVESKSKKSSVGIIISICTIAVFIAIRFSPLPIIIMDMIETSKSMNDEEMNNYFINNKKDFEKAKDILEKYPYIGYIRKESSQIEGVYEYKTKDNMYILSKQEITKDSLAEINNSGITTIMKKLKFKQMYNYGSHIGFLQSSSLSDANGVLYIPDMTKFNSESYNAEQYDIKQIDDGWYIFHDK